MKVSNFLFAQLRRYKKTLLLIFVVATASVLISSGISIWLSDYHNLTLPSVGTIKTIGVEAYWDPNLENKTENILWGEMWPGSSQNSTLYIRSVSNVEITLQLYPSNITPVAMSEYIDLSWNYKGKTISPNDVIEVTLFLSMPDDYSFIRYVVANEMESFSMDIHIVPYE
ncbi:MAG: hypothetical protein PVI43_05175 [Candidatus Bathyarchaeota archaeon]